MINLHDIEYRSERIAQIGKEGKDYTFEIMNVGSITFVINTVVSPFAILSICPQ